jgi:exosortase/archaeosortase family protein
MLNFNYITLKIDTIGYLRLEEFMIEDGRIESPFLFRLVDNQYFVENRIRGDMEIVSLVDKYGEASGIYRVGASKSFLIKRINYSGVSLITVLLMFIIFLYIIVRESAALQRGNIIFDLSIEGYSPYYLYLLGFTPIIYDLILYPSLLLRSWIGDAQIIFGYIIYFMSLKSLIDLFDDSKVTYPYIICALPLLYMFNQVLLTHFYSVLNYFDEWVIYSYISLVNTIIAGSLFIILTMPIICRMRKDVENIILLLVSPMYLFLLGTIYFVNVSSSPIERFLSGLPYSVSYLSNAILSYIGYSTYFVSYEFGSIIYILHNSKLLSIFIGWPCTGITGIFLFVGFAMLEYSRIRNIVGKMDSRKYLLLLILGTILIYILNIFRVTMIILLNLWYGWNASEIFHSIGYEIIFLIWVFIYLYILDYLFIFGGSHTKPSI